MAVVPYFCLIHDQEHTKKRSMLTTETISAAMTLLRPPNEPMMLVRVRESGRSSNAMFNHDNLASVWTPIHWRKLHERPLMMYFGTHKPLRHTVQGKYEVVQGITGTLPHDDCNRDRELLLCVPEFYYQTLGSFHQTLNHGIHIL